MTSSPHVAPHPAPARPAPHARLWRFWRGLAAAIGALLLAGTWWGAAVVREAPSVTELAPLIQQSGRRPLPATLATAVIEHEDRRFYQHPGIDLPGLLRATGAVLRGQALQGGSTLTQQLVKNTLLVDQHAARTVTRKVQEAWLAVQVERRYSKAQILQAYLNVAYWGAIGDRQLIGAEQAAQAYFGQSAGQLDLARSAYLAVLLPAPARAAQPAVVRPLVGVLLDQLVRDGRATPAQAAAARLELPQLAVLR